MDLFFIETHSDYLIDRYRIRCKKNRSVKETNSQVLFFERKQKVNNVFNIDILPNGELDFNQPKSYRKFFLNEGMKLLS